MPNVSNYISENGALIDICSNTIPNTSVSIKYISSDVYYNKILLTK